MEKLHFFRSHDRDKNYPGIYPAESWAVAWGIRGPDCIQRNLIPRRSSNPIQASRLREPPRPNERHPSPPKLHEYARSEAPRLADGSNCELSPTAAAGRRVWEGMGAGFKEAGRRVWEGMGAGFEGSSVNEMCEIDAALPPEVVSPMPVSPKDSSLARFDVHGSEHCLIVEPRSLARIGLPFRLCFATAASALESLDCAGRKPHTRLPTFGTSPSQTEKPSIRHRALRPSHTVQFRATSERKIELCYDVVL